MGGEGTVRADNSADASRRRNDQNGLDVEAAARFARGAADHRGNVQHACVFGEAALLELVTAFQDGEKASDFWNGDVAATEGHLSLMLAKHLEGDPLSYSHLAMNRAAKEGSMDVVAWLHDYTDVPQVASAMDSAAAGGHLEVQVLRVLVL